MNEHEPICAIAMAENPNYMNELEYKPANETGRNPDDPEFIPDDEADPEFLIPEN